MAVILFRCQCVKPEFLAVKIMKSDPLIWRDEFILSIAEEKFTSGFPDISQYSQALLITNRFLFRWIIIAMNVWGPSQ